MTRDLAWHRKRVSRIVNFNDTEVDQDFAGEEDTYGPLDDAINEAAEELYNRIAREASYEHLRETVTVTWESSDTTFTLPDYIDPASIISIHDETDDGFGHVMQPQFRWSRHEIFWRDADTLQWGIEGPPEDKTLVFSYVASAPELVAPTQYFKHIPYRHRWSVNWGAACLLTLMADQEPPIQWLRKREETASDLVLALSKGKPLENNPHRIRSHRIQRYT